MKRILFFVLVLVFIAGCSDVSGSSAQLATNTTDVKPPQTEPSVTDASTIQRENPVLESGYIGDIWFVEKQWCDKELAAVSEGSLYDTVSEALTPIHSKQEALEAGDALLHKLQEDGYYPDYMLVEVWHYAEENFWSFSYGLKEWKQMDADCDLLVLTVNGNKGCLLQGGTGDGSVCPNK